jgi:hypothetical protein
VKKRTGTQGEGGSSGMTTHRHGDVVHRHYIVGRLPVDALPCSTSARAVRPIGAKKMQCEQGLEAPYFGLQCYESSAAKGGWRRSCKGRMAVIRWSTRANINIYFCHLPRLPNNQHIPNCYLYSLYLHHRLIIFYS